MKSITIHNMNEKLSSRIDSLSKELGLSKNKLIKKLLSQVLGIENNQKPKIDISMLSFSMTEAEANEITKIVSVFDEIETTDWL